MAFRPGVAVYTMRAENGRSPSSRLIGMIESVPVRTHARARVGGLIIGVEIQGRRGGLKKEGAESIPLFLFWGSSFASEGALSPVKYILYRYTHVAYGRAEYFRTLGGKGLF